MALQNRVTPFGDIVAMPERGLFTGNRGIIHDPATRTLLGRRWASKAWITCLCDFRGVRRAVRSEEHTSELQSLMRISYAVFCLKKKRLLNTTHWLIHEFKRKLMIRLQ